MKPIELKFKDVTSTASFEHPEYGEITLEITDHHVESDGIGAYECHGFRGFDHGDSFEVVDGINIQSVNGEAFDESKHLHVQKAVADMWMNGHLETEVEEILDDEPDYPEDDGE